MQRALPLLSLLLLAGCVGDPDLDQVSASLAMTIPVARVDWEQAPAGCEGLGGPGVDLRRVAGERELGALVAPTGRVLCVDSMTLLSREREGDAVIPRVERDPTPTPLIEGAIDPRAL